MLYLLEVIYLWWLGAPLTYPVLPCMRNDRLFVAVVYLICQSMPAIVRFLESLGHLEFEPEKVDEEEGKDEDDLTVLVATASPVMQYLLCRRALALFVYSNALACVLGWYEAVCRLDSGVYNYQFLVLFAYYFGTIWDYSDIAFTLLHPALDDEEEEDEDALAI